MVPKRDLMAGLVVRLERGQLKIAEGLKGGEELLREMAGMRVRVTASGREEYGRWRAGEHDDLVVALALACWGGTKYYPGGVGGMRSGRGWRVGSGMRGRRWGGWCEGGNWIFIWRPSWVCACRVCSGLQGA